MGRVFRYSEWDASQNVPDLNADEIMGRLGQDIMSHGDLSYILRNIQQTGFNDNQGKKLPGIQDLLQKLRQQRQSQLEKYKLDSVMDDIRKKLDEVVKTERQGIDQKLADARQKAEQADSDLSPDLQQKLLKNFEDRAAQNKQQLEQLPRDAGGKIQELNKYSFMDENAQRQFRELMDTLKNHAVEKYARDLAEQIKDMTPENLAAMRNMLEVLNQMLEQRAKGGEPDFDSFMDQFGDFFPDKPGSLDELTDSMRSRMSQAQALMNSLSPSERKALSSALESALDEGTRYELSKLADNMDILFPNMRAPRYPFSGDEPVSYDEAMKLMETMRKMAELESQLKESQYHRTLDNVDDDLLKEVLGDEAASELDKLRDITKVLEDSGYITYKDNRYELTPRGMRKIGQKAIEDIFAKLRKDRAGNHSLNLKGGGGDRIEETKAYEFGDDFQLHLQKTIMNAIRREAHQPPVKLSTDDFEVYRTEGLTRSATVLMLDLSLSMPMRGNFQAAKRVAIALDELISSKFPQDTLYIVGFSSYARRIKKQDLSCMGWDEFDPYTNMQHGLFLARKLLSKEICTNKQIILVSDGEPTAHIEDGNVYFQYPPSPRTLQITLKEVKNCTKKGIIINTFMLESGRFLSNFVTRMAQINKGRVFYTNAECLGQYLLVDYVSNKRRKLG